MFRLELRKIRSDSVSYQPVAAMEIACDSTYEIILLWSTDAIEQAGPECLLFLTI